MADQNNIGEQQTPHSIPTLLARPEQPTAVSEWLGGRESSNNYGAVNQYGYAGKYQFGKLALQETGYKDAQGNWTGKGGINSQQDWLTNPEVQEVAQNELLAAQYRQLEANGAAKYIGTEFNGETVTKEGLMAAAHLVGAGGVNKMLRTGVVPQDANGTKASEYLSAGNKVAKAPVSLSEKKQAELPQTTQTKQQDLELASNNKMADISGMTPQQIAESKVDRLDFMLATQDMGIEASESLWKAAQNYDPNVNPNTLFEGGSLSNDLLSALNSVNSITAGAISIPATLRAIGNRIGISEDEMAAFASIEDKRRLGIEDFTELEARILGDSTEDIFGGDSTYQDIKDALEAQGTVDTIKDALSLDDFVDSSLTQEFSTKGTEIFNNAFEGKLGVSEMGSQIVDLIKENPQAITQASIESIPYMIAAVVSMPFTVAAVFANKYTEALDAYEAEHGKKAAGGDLAELIGWTATSAIVDMLGDRLVAGNTVGLSKVVAKLVGKKAAEKIGGNLVTRVATSAAGEVVAEGGASVTEQLASKQDLSKVDKGKAASAGLLGGLSGAQTTGTIDGAGSVAKTTGQVLGSTADSAAEAIDNSLSRNAYKQVVEQGKTELLPKGDDPLYDAALDITARQAIAEGQGTQVQAQQIQEATSSLTDSIKGFLQKGQKIPTKVLANYKKGVEALSKFKEEVQQNVDKQAANLATVTTNNANTQLALDTVLGSVELVTNEQAQAMLANDNLQLTEDQTNLLTSQIDFNNQLAEASAEIVDGTDEQPGLKTFQSMLMNAANIGDSATAQAVIDTAIKWKEKLQGEANGAPKDITPDGKNILAKGIIAVGGFIAHAVKVLISKGIIISDVIRKHVAVARAGTWINEDGSIEGEVIDLSENETHEMAALTTQIQERAAITNESEQVAAQVILGSKDLGISENVAQAARQKYNIVEEKAPAEEATADEAKETDPTAESIKEEVSKVADEVDVDTLISGVFDDMAQGSTTDEAIQSVRTQYGDTIANAVEAGIEKDVRPTRETTATRITNKEGETKVPLKEEGQSVTDWFRSINLVKAYMEQNRDQDEQASPNLLQIIPDTFKQMVSTPSIVADHLGRALDSNQVKALNLLVRFERHFSNNVWNKVYNPDGAFTDDKDVMRYLGENGVFEDNVKSSVSVAIYSWIATRAGDTLYNDVETIRNILGAVEEYIPTAEEIELYSKVGVGRTTLRDTLGKDILKVLNIKSTKEAPINLEPNLVTSLGQFAIELLMQEGYLTETKVGSGENTQTFFRVATQEVNGYDELAPDLKPIQELNTAANRSMQGVTFMDALFGTQSHRTGPHLTPIKKIAKKMKGTAQKLGKAIREGLKKHQNRKHYLKQDNLNLFNALGAGELAIILGAKDPDSVHSSRKETQESINSNLDRSIQQLEEFQNTLENIDDPFYFEHEVWKTLRIGIKSNTVNPQGDKLHRAAIAQDTWRTTADLNNAKTMQQFWNSMEEPLSIDSMEDLESAKDGRLFQAVYIIKGFLANGEFDNASDAKFITEIASEYGDGALALDAMVNLARMVEAEDSGSNTFEVDMFVEVDGKTNGPIIGLLQYAGAANATELLAKLRKGGFFTKGDVTNMADFDGRDSYQEVAQMWAQAIDAMMQSGGDTERLVAAQELFGDMLETKTDGSLDITKTTRNLAKNPLMVTVYGAGSLSVHDALGNTMIDKIYDAMEDLATNPSKAGTKALEKNIRILTGDKSFKLVAGGELQATLTKKQIATIKEYVGATYGIAVTDAISNHYSAFINNRTTINKGIDIMFRMYAVARKDAIDSKLKELQEAGEVDPNVNNISNEDLQEIDKQLKEISPIIHNYFSKLSNNVNQGTDLGKSESVLQKGKGKGNFKQEVKYKNGRKLEAYGSFNEPAAPGVGPGVISIHNQDAAVQHILAGGDIGGVGVHDAYLWGVDEAVDGGQLQNEAFLRVMKEMSVPEEVAKGLRRSAAAFTTYINQEGKDPASLKKGVQDLRVNNDFSNDRATYAKVMILSDQAKAMKEEVLKHTAYLDQYAAHDGSSSIKVGDDTSTENIQQEAKEATQELGSTDRTNQQDATNAGTYDSSQRVDGSNLEDVFAHLSHDEKLDNPAHISRLQALVGKMSTKLVKPFLFHIRSIPGNENYGVMTPTDVFLSQATNGTTSPQMTASGIPMSSREIMAHEVSHLIYAAGLEVDSVARREVQRMFNNAKAHLDYTAFLSDPNIDVNDPANADVIAAAKERYNYIFSNRQGNQLHEFAAFGLTNENFLNALNTVPFGKKSLLGDTWYQTLQNIIERIIDLFNGNLLSNSKGTNDAQLLKLLDSMLVVSNKNTTETAFDKASAALGGLNDAIANRLGNSRILRNPKNIVAKSVGQALRGDRANREITKDLLERFNELRGYYSDTKHSFFTQIVDEFIGRTSANAAVRDMLRKVKHTVDQPRLRAIESMTKAINDSFHTPISDKERKALTKVLLKLDIDAISGLGMEHIQSLLENPNQVDKEIARLEGQLNSSPFYNFYTNAARNLGYFMATGNSKLAVTHMNAHNIARLYGDHLNMDNVTEHEAGLVEPIIDQLATLYGIKETSNDLKFAVARTLHRENQVDPVNNGVTAVLLAHKALKQDALDNQFADQDESLRIKGWTTEEYKDHKTLKFAPASEQAELEGKGYVMGGTVQRDRSDPHQEPLHIFIANQGEKSPWMGQLVSLIDDARKGASTLDVERQYQSGDPALLKELRKLGLLDDSAPSDARFNAAVITYRKRQGLSDMHASSRVPTEPGRPMIPVFSPDGRVVDWRYMANEQMREETLERNDDIADVLGSMAGNVVSKVNSKQSNREVIKMLKEEYWDKEKDTDKANAYVTIGPAPDNTPLSEEAQGLTDLWRMMPQDMKDEARKAFGESGIRIRKDLIVPVFGYRKMSVREVFAQDRETRNAWQNLVVDVFDAMAKNITSVFPNFKYRTGAALANLFETGAMDVISEIKNTVIVKSGFVTVGNFLSNTVYLMMNGMSPYKAAKYQHEAFKGINKYTKDEGELRTLQLEIQNKDLTPSQVRNREARIAQLRKELASNPVAITIRAGLMPTIAENIDVSGAGGSVIARGVRKGVEALPPSMQGIAKNLVQTQDSQLYHTMSNLVQQSDFVARHAMLKHWVETQEAKQGRPLSQEQFMYLVGEAEELFINFDTLAPRGLQYVDDIGLGWFTKYAMRNIRSTARTAVTNPGRVGMMISGASALGLGLDSPFDSAGRMVDTAGTGAFTVGVGTDNFTGEFGLRNDLGFRLSGWADMPWSAYGPANIV